MLMGLGIGIPFALKPLVSILNTSEFYAPLTHSLILTRGTGNPTYTRATAAWEFDNEGKLVTVASGAARFGGARMVRNLAFASESFDGAWTKVNNVVGSGKSITFAQNNSRIYSPAAFPAKTVFSCKAVLSTSDTGKKFRFTYFDSVLGWMLSTDITVPSDGVVSHVFAESVNATSFIGFTSASDWSASETINLAATGGYVQFENVTGQSDTTASEYVSVGVLSAPYHGAGVDGVKYFSTNKDGSPIAASSLLGYHSEGARTNSLLYSRDLTNAAWTATNVTAAKTATGIDNAANSASTLTAGSANATILQTLTLASAVRSSSAYVKARTLTFSPTELVTNGTFDTDITGWTQDSLVDGSAVVSGGVLTLTNSIYGFKRITQPITTVIGKRYSVSYTGSANSRILGSNSNDFGNSAFNPQTSPFTFVATATTTYLVPSCYVATDAATATFDNISVKECACAFTRNGGTTWTDITSQINSSTWTRVKIENSSVTNPSIGFLIATSGDAIDVDVVQDEAGAFCSTPIITTTAAVTRNADTLVYAATSNISGVNGTVLYSTRLDMSFAASSYNPRWFWCQSDSNNFVRCNHNSGQNFTKKVAGTEYVAREQTSYLAATPYKHGMKWSSISGLDFYQNGVTGDNRSTNTDAVTLGASIDIGYGAATGQIHGYIKQTHIWQSALTDAQLQQVTS